MSSVVMPVAVPWITGELESSVADETFGFDAWCIVASLAGAGLARGSSWIGMVPLRVN